ncbi:hypothetical protein JHK87_047788 [Glycine soja]|nr:hypothetical protein JHK87_047788 [Glycine soja]
MSAPHVSPLEMATLHTYFAGGIGEICMAHVSQVVLAKHALLLCVPLDLAVDVALLPDLACVATLTVPQISFSNSRLFPHADDPLLQETPSELAERRSDVGVGGHIELHPPVKGRVVDAYHAVEVLAGMEDLGHVLCH